jgi:hypothetical protein
MLKVGSWLHTKKLHTNASTQSLDSLAEQQNCKLLHSSWTPVLIHDRSGVCYARYGVLRNFMEETDRAVLAAICIMNDDVEAAEAGLAKGNSAFHKV